MGDWKETTLSEVTDLLPGYAFKGMDFGMGTSRGVKIKDVQSGAVSVETLDALDVTNYNQERIKKYRLGAGDHLITMTGNMGRVATIPASDHPIYLNQRVAKLLPKANVVEDYLLYVIKSQDFIDYCITHADSETAQPNISAGTILEYEFSLPPENEQRAIASVLSSLDDKIDLLYRQNKTLEAMAETLFRQWFLEGEGTPVPVSDIIDFNPSLPLKNGQSAPYLEMKNLQETSSIPDGIRYREFTSGMRFQNGDTLLARISPCLENGKCCYVQCMIEGEVGWGSTEFIVMRSKKGYSPFLTYALAKSSDFIDFAANTLAGTSGRQRAQLNIVMEFQLVQPDRNSVATINAQLDGFAKRIDLNHRQITSLTALRDTLLPKLMSGEVRVDYHDQTHPPTTTGHE
ncbi:MAG: restriction endonuclease subunit S [Flavobacteriales bacterium]